MVVFLLCIIIWLIATKDCCKKDSGYSGYRDYSLGPTKEEYEEIMKRNKRLSKEELKEERKRLMKFFSFYWIARVISEFFGLRALLITAEPAACLDLIVGTMALISVFITVIESGHSVKVLFCLATYWIVRFGFGFDFMSLLITPKSAALLDVTVLCITMLFFIFMFSSEEGLKSLRDFEKK